MTEHIGINSYRILEHIHQSRRFILYKAEAMLSGDIVLIKTQDPTQVSNTQLADSLISEADTAHRLDHRAIRKGKGFLQDGLNAYFLGEFISGKALAALLQPESEPIPKEQILAWALTLADTICYTSSLGMSHQNLNPYNIIIDDANQLRVIGFGKVHEAWRNSEMNVRALHPILYVAPEVYQGTGPQSNVDVFSWAVIVYQMLCGVLPWRIDRFLSPEGQKQQSMSRSVIMPEILGKDVPDWLFTLLLS
ncbi:MAG TPA: protein kinase, partial [Candidatus Cloacimonadota bacterium]|nr:protein kinase [Candidatus Cloacimonadota bacterium]